MGIKNPCDATSKLLDDEKGVVLTDTLGGKQSVTTVSESGLYSLIMRSRKKAMLERDVAGMSSANNVETDVIVWGIESPS